MSQKKDDFSSTYSVDNFSSTAKLADSGIGSKSSINTNDDYNPFEHRVVEHPNTTMGALTHLLKSSLGTGILAMPYAFKHSGLTFGAVGTVVVGIICTYCVHILVKASHIICRRTRIPVLGFSETAEAVFGNGPKGVRRFSVAARHFVDIALVVTYVLGDCVYVVFISANLQQLFAYWYPETKDTLTPNIYMLFIMVPLLILSQVRELKHLVPFSFIANVFMIISFAITLYYMFNGIPNPADRNQFTEFSLLPVFFSTVIFAMEGIGTVMPIENSMSKPQQFLGCPGVLNVAMSVVVILYATFGFFGYLKYGETTESSITLNLPVNEIPAQIVKLLIALSVFFTYFLQMYVPMDILWRKFIGKRIDGTRNRHIAQIVIRCIFVLLTVGIAEAVPNLGAIIGLVGSICFSTLGLLIPAVIETVLLWDGELGIFKYKLIINIILSAFALFALVAGTIQSIESLIAGS